MKLKEIGFISTFILVLAFVAFMTYMALSNANIGARTGDDNWDESETIVYYDSGNVGIGTSTPEYLFHVAGNDVSSSTAAIGSANDGSNIGKMCIWNGLSYTILQFAGDDTITIGDFTTSTTCI